MDLFLVVFSVLGFLDEMLKESEEGMSNVYTEYWKEAVLCALDTVGIKITDEQANAVARDMEIAHDQYSMAFYHPENPMIAELKETKKLLALERSKVFCKECEGKGRITTQGPYHCSDSQCYKCRGEGKHKP